MGCCLTQDLVGRIARYLGMADGAAFARGSAGLYALLSAIAERSGAGEVVVPSICCESVALAVAYSGHQPRFADVSPESLCVTPATLAPLMSPRTRAVVVVHVFGADAQCETFAALRRAHPAAVFVEDIAHAIGGHDRNARPLGAGLDAALLSFAGDKILPGNGGMILRATDRPVPGPEEWRGRIPAPAPSLPQTQLALELRNLVHGIADAWREQTGEAAAPGFLDSVDRFRDLIIRGSGIADAPALAAAFDRLAEIRAQRYGRYARYREEISGAGVRVVELHERSNCWRCPVVVDEPARARAITRQLRALGIHASNHYFPLHLLFATDRCPSSESIASRIVNLWVDESATAATIGRTGDVIRHA